MKSMLLLKKPPGPQTADIDDFLPTTMDLDEINPTNFETLDPRIKEALARNAKIPTYSTTTHPLGPITLHTTEEVTYWAKRNYIKPQNEARAEEIIQEWVEQQIAEEVTSAKARFALLAVPKTDDFGKQTDIRLCIDMSPGNKYIVVDKYPLPTLAEILAVPMKKRGPGTRRSKIDLTGAFHRIEIIDSWVHFMFKGKLYRVNHGFFGVNILPSHFQRVSDAVARECSFLCRVYLDDAFNEGGTPEEDILQCVELIDRYTFYKLIINQKKSYFGQFELPALGYIAGGNGKRMNPAKCAAIMNWQPPTTGIEMARFLGVVNFNREHLPEFAHKAKPLDACRKMTTIEWSPILQKAFEDVKEIVRRDLSLVVRDPNALLVLCTDASELGLGFVLAQPKPEFRHLDKKLIRPEHLEILKYGSVGITNNLTHGGSTKRELAGVIFAIKKCYDELVGNDFLLITDHEALVWLFTQEHTSPMLHRWIDLLMSLSFTVLHWLGLWNFLADAMSRPSCTNATMIKDIPATELPEHEERIEAYQLGEERSTELKEKAAFIRNKTIPNENERQQIIKDTHEEGHFGIQQTFLKIWHKGLWWPKIREQITKEIENCQTCLRHTTKRVGFHPLTPITESRPNEGWAVDLFFATEQEGKGGRLHPILIAMDICTGFVLDLKIMKTKQATEVSDELWKMICVFGPPKYLISDNGKEFLNQTLARLFKTIGTQHRTISSYHASANGRPERAIQDVKTLIKKLTEGNLRNLEKLLPKIQLAYNTRISSRTLSAPFALEFGRNANAFEDYRKLPEMKEVNEEEIKRNWDKMNKTILPAINERVVEREEQRAAKWDATHNVIDRYTPGQFVMAKEVVPGSKWNEKWVGPFEVIRCNRNGA